MTAPSATPRLLYRQWVEEQIEDYKCTLTRDELMEIADRAVEQLYDAPDGQYALTELLLRDAVDALLFSRLKLPCYRQWRRSCQSDTPPRPMQRTAHGVRAAS